MLESIKIIKRSKNYLGKNWILSIGKSGYLCKKISNNLKLVQKRNRFYFLNSKNLIEFLRLRKNLISVVYANHLKLKLIGVGYRFEYNETLHSLNIKLGFSHEVIFNIPKNIFFFSTRYNYLLHSVYLNDLKNFAFKLRSLRTPEPYKGKGVRYDFEKIKRKEGKKSNV